MKKKRNSKKGFTLVEVVLAVVIAVFVSVAASSVVLMSRTSSVKASQRQGIVGQMSTVLECFKAADDSTDFQNALAFAYDDNQIYVGGSRDMYSLYFYYNNDGQLATRQLTQGYEDTQNAKFDFVVHVTIECKTAGNFVNAQFNATAYEKAVDTNDLSDSHILYDFSEEFENGYRKGTGA